MITNMSKELQIYAWYIKKCHWNLRRRMESVENQVEQLGRSLADMRGVEGLREESLKERFLAVEKSLRDVNRGVQLIRDKQVESVSFKEGFTP